ncbi:hypothetical protein FA95DRAFT_1600465 [Auriscalpium vulgare]|uniref:Uncharacterized protein n=1 Tax=Auriscalpium vulgare TaxID=40419 RepID=A0ACB8SCS1_9AGAM|nr:hypothetical protein FA95DRAFT_1600465 [Auriscalpium vulgare]
MACNPSPTETLYETLTSTTTVIFFTESVETLAPTPSTVISVSCLSSVSDVCAASTTTTEVTSIPGAVTVVQVPVTQVNVIAQAIPTATLFASCTSASSLPPSTVASSTSPSSPTPSPPDSLSASGFIPTTTTPPPTVVTQQTATTLDNGLVSSVGVTFTSQPSASLVYLTSSPPASHPSVVSQQTGPSGNLAPILGGVVGGFVFLIALVLLIWIIYRRSLRRRHFEDEDSPSYSYPVTRDRDRRRELELANEPKPYEYGLVGHSSSYASVLTPPSTPPASASLNHYSRESTMLHMRADSTTPLMSTPSLGPGPSSPPPERLSPSSSSLLLARQRRASHMEAPLGHLSPSVTSAASTRRHSASSVARLSGSLQPATPSDYLGQGTDSGGSPSPSSQMMLLPLTPESSDPPVGQRAIAPTSMYRRTSDTPRTPPRAGPSYASFNLIDTDAAPPMPKRSSRRIRQDSSSSSDVFHNDGGRVPNDRVVVVDESPPPTYAS